MRVKFIETDKSPKFEFGETYSVILFGCASWCEFQFTRKNSVFAKTMSAERLADGEVIKDCTNTYKMSKRELKQLVSSDLTQFVIKE